MDRRIFLKGTTASAAALCTSLPGRAYSDSFSDDEIAEIILSEGDPYFHRASATTDGEVVEFGAMSKEKFLKYIKSDGWRWYKIPEGDRPMPEVPLPNNSPDLSHLSSFAAPPETSFMLTIEHLEFLASRNSFEFDSSNSRRLIALRGCMLADPGVSDSGWAESHQLVEVACNHIDLRCLIGVWDADSDRIRLFKASTVPNVNNMFAFRNEITGCNQMPTGLHRYVIGTHRAGSKTKQIGAFRQARPIVVLRTTNDLSYRNSDDFDFWDDHGWPWDNIHSSIFSTRGRGVEFSSAGCQVVEGNYDWKNDPSKTRGAWAEFRVAAGLPRKADTSADGRQYDYMLITGREAALAAQGNDDFNSNYDVVRFGSTGPKAKAVQEMIGAGSDGKFFAGSFYKLIQWQEAKGNLALTGIHLVKT